MHEKSNTLNRIVLGTVALGTPYGIGDKQKPDIHEVVQLFRLARDAGISRLDTAPSYGTAEDLVGKFAGSFGFEIWTKLSNINLDGEALLNARKSIKNSLDVMNQENINCLQWHNWSADLQENSFFLEIWDELRGSSRIKNLGASTYGVDNALAAVKSGLFDLVQIEWNLLNQSVLDAVAQEANNRGVKLALRSIFLQGVLTDKGENLSGPLVNLNKFRENAKRLATKFGLTLNALALRAALDHPIAPFVLVGPDRLIQLKEICRDAQLPVLSKEVLSELQGLTVSDVSLVDPRLWNFR
jgi:aryl-alcohol dehydrogenase-like predicted oxidoreductase